MIRYHSSSSRKRLSYLWYTLCKFKSNKKALREYKPLPRLPYFTLLYLMAKCMDAVVPNCITWRTFNRAVHWPGSIFTPPPVEGRGFVFARFLCLFLCQQHYEKTAGQICMKFSGKVWSDHGTTWFNFESIRINWSAGRRSCCLLSPAIAQSQLHSLGCGRGLALTSQLHRWQQGAGFVEPHTTAFYIFKRYCSANWPRPRGNFSEL